MGGAMSSGGTTSTGGTSSVGGATSAGGATSTGGTKAAGGATSAGGSTSTGGTKAAGGTTSAGGATSAGGTKAMGGATPAGGATSTGGGTSMGGTTSSGGVTSSGGTPSTGGTPAITTDCLGQALAKPGDSTSTSKQYLNLGDMRLIDNRWGSDILGCSSASYKVYVNSDKSIGYDFNRPKCDASGKKANPDFPEIEFGVAPFGKKSSNLTSPWCSSTTVLPTQIKSLTSASVSIENWVSTYTSGNLYDANFEFWISKQNPIENDDAGVYAEIIVFLSWNANRMSSSAGGWSCTESGSLTAGGIGINLCHQSDTWGGSAGQWRFFNFNLNTGADTFNGKADVKAILDWVMSKYSGFTTDMWLTRIEVGTEIDDSTAGKSTIKNLTFEVNGTSKSITLAQ
jgi:hypothetical protein